MAATLVSISVIPASNTIDWLDSTTFTVMATYSDGRTRDITDSCDYTIPSGDTSVSDGIVTIANDIIEITGVELWCSTNVWHDSDLW